MASDEKKEVRVGYALREKRIASFMLPELLEHGLTRGVTFVRIQTDKPLEEQGPFDMVLHKIEGEEWARNLKEYSVAHPEAVVVDEYDAVHKLDDRRQMLEVVSLLDAETLGVAVEVPGQLILDVGTKPEDIPDIVEKAGFRLPAVAKPLEANGTHSSHSLALVLNRNALLKLETPLVLQEFVNHGGILFKLYLLGDKVMVFRRQSLPDIPTAEESATAAIQGSTAEAVADEKSGIVEFNRISNVHLSEEELQDSRVTDPPPELMHKLGNLMRQHLHLHAFNVDILRDGGHGDRYYIVDINYMPGYERIPGFPKLFVDFVVSRVEARRAALASLGGRPEPKGLLEKELQEPVTPPAHPYPVLMGKKKWVYFKAAMKLCGLEHRSRTGGGVFGAGLATAAKATMAMEAEEGEDGKK